MNRTVGNNDIIRDVGLSLLSEGKTIKVIAGGYSMFPAIKPGTLIFIEPIPEGSFPLPGEIIAWKRESGLVVHRVIRVLRNGPLTTFITRGDSCAREDNPFPVDMIAGKVIRTDDGSGKTLSGDELVRKPLYLYNRLLVWILLRIKRII
jgi:signal peptidase I